MGLYQPRNVLVWTAEIQNLPNYEAYLIENMVNVGNSPTITYIGITTDQNFRCYYLRNYWSEMDAN